jgi:hypothetical protein
MLRRCPPRWWFEAQPRSQHSGIVTGFGVLPDGELIVLASQEGAIRLAPS